MSKKIQKKETEEKQSIPQGIGLDKAAQEFMRAKQSDEEPDYVKLSKKTLESDEEEMLPRKGDKPKYKEAQSLHAEKFKSIGERFLNKTKEQDEEDDNSEQESEEESKEQEKEETDKKEGEEDNPYRDDPLFVKAKELTEQVQKSVTEIKGKSDSVQYLKSKSHELYKFNGELIGQIKELKKQLEEKVDKNSYEEIKKKYEDRYFEDSNEWKQSVEKPLEDAQSDFNKWLRAGKFEEGTEEHRTVVKIFPQLDKALKSGDDVEYYVAIDTIAELLPTGAKTRFVSSAAKLWETFQYKENAFKNKDSARQEILKKSEEHRSTSITAATGVFEDTFNSWERENEDSLKYYTGSHAAKELYKYEEVREAVPKVKELIKDAIRTGSFSNKLIELINGGLLQPLKAREIQVLLTANQELRKELDRLKGKREEDKEVIRKYSPSGKKRPRGGDESKFNPKEGGAFAFAAKKMGLELN